jgi:hypothetical protein
MMAMLVPEKERMVCSVKTKMTNRGGKRYYITISILNTGKPFSFVLFFVIIFVVVNIL